jgi:hypothetical protein
MRLELRKLFKKFSNEHMEAQKKRTIFQVSCEGTQLRQNAFLGEGTSRKTELSLRRL